MAIRMFKRRLTCLMVSVAICALYLIGTCKFSHFSFCESSSNQDAPKLAPHEMKANSPNVAKNITNKKNVTEVVQRGESIHLNGTALPVKQNQHDATRSKESPSISPCTLSDVQKRKNTVVLTTTNAAFVDFADNWLESVRRTKTCPNITIVAEDDLTVKHYEQRREAGLHVLKTNSGQTSPDRLAFDSKDYRKLVNKRQSYILSFLEKGYNVLFTDVDMFWLKDPFPFFDGDFDMALARDTSRFFCAGFVYYKPTETTIKFLKIWIDFMKSDPNLTPDQEVMSKLLNGKKVPELKLRVLSSSNFPNGAIFFVDKWRQENKDVVVVHNNFVVGHDVKIERFRKVNMWLL